MASKSGQDSAVAAGDIEELLDGVDKTLDRLKTLYEQYFLGIQKQAPGYIHSDVERKLRDLTQMQIRNTGLRYRLNSIQAKFAAYNSYWRRTLRQIENGTYVRNLHKIGRAAARSGADIPEEILAAMPRRMREQVLKDREAALASARRHKQLDEPAPADDELLSLDDEPAIIKEGTELRRQVRGAHVVQEDAEFDLDAFFKEVEGGGDDDKTPADQPPVMPAAPPQRTATPVANPSATGQLRTPTGPLANPSATGQLRTPTGPVPAVPGQRATGAVPIVPGQRATGPVPTVPQTGAIPTVPGQRATGPVPIVLDGIVSGPIPVVVDPMTGAIPTVPGQRVTGAIPTVPGQRATGAIPTVPGQRATGAIPTMPQQRAAGPVPTVSQTGQVPAVSSPRATGPVPVVPPVPGMPRAPIAPSQASRPNPIAPGSAAVHGDVSVESMAGPFPRQQTTPGTAAPAGPDPSATGPVPRQPNPSATGPVPRTPTGPVPNPRATGPVPRQSNPSATGPVPRTPTGPVPRPSGAPRPAPPVSAQSQPTRATPKSESPGSKAPPGMTDADVNALYAKYVKAKESVGEKVGPGGYGKLLNTISQQAPKIMEQYKAKAVDFSVVVKDNQVIIRAKPKP